MENSLLLLGLFADTVDANKGMVVRKAAAGVASRKVLEARRNATLVLLATNIWFCCESVLMRTLLAEAVQEDRRSQIANRNRNRCVRFRARHFIPRFTTPSWIVDPLSIQHSAFSIALNNITTFIGLFRSV